LTVFSARLGRYISHRFKIGEWVWPRQLVASAACNCPSAKFPARVNGETVDLAIEKRLIFSETGIVVFHHISAWMAFQFRRKGGSEHCRRPGAALVARI